MLKGRFGNFYLYKVGSFTIVLGTILFLLFNHFFNNPKPFNFSNYVFIFLVCIFGISLCMIPSMILSDILYKIMSRSKLSNQKVLLLTITFSLITTNSAYYIFFKNVNGNLDNNSYYFLIVYSICLILGFFIFKQKPKILINDSLQ